MPNTERFRPGFLRRVLLFAVPSGVICAAAALTTYTVSSSMELDAGASEEAALLASQAAATTCLFIVGHGRAPAVGPAAERHPARHRAARWWWPSSACILIPWFATFFALTSVGLNAPTARRGRGRARSGAGLVWVATLVTDRWRRA